MAILVTGGTGFIGATVLAELCAAGETVRALCRKGPPSDLDLAALPVEWIAGDLLDPPSLRYALAGCDRVYHIGGRIATHSRDRDLAYAVNVDGARNIFAAALDATVRRVVYTGSIFALGVGKNDASPVDETVSYNLAHLRSPYVRAKRQAELLIPAFQERGLDIVTVYPGFCAGPGDRNLTSSRLLVAFLRGQLPGYPPGGLCQIDVRDAAHAHIQAMRYAPANATYLVPGHNVTYQDIFATLAAVTDRHAPRFPLPLPLLDVAGALLERISRHPLLDSGTAQLLHHVWWYNGKKARLQFGLNYRPLAETLADAVAWFQARGVVK